VAAPQFDQTMEQEAADSSIIVDCTQLGYISSAGLRSLLILGKRLEKGRGRLLLCGMSGFVLEVFQLSGFNHLFTVVDTVEEAHGLFS
jgi:anti-anti-sigma factor